MTGVKVTVGFRGHPVVGYAVLVWENMVVEDVILDGGGNGIVISVEFGWMRKYGWRGSRAAAFL